MCQCPARKLMARWAMIHVANDEVQEPQAVRERIKQPFRKHLREDNGDLGVAWAQAARQFP